MDKIIHQTVTMEKSSRDAFHLFVDKKHLESWLTVEANIEPETGGAYELFWDPDTKDRNSTQGCKILAIEPGEFITFEWKGPEQFKGFMNVRKPLTNVMVSFIPINQNRTTIHLIHSGWGSSPEWDIAHGYFTKAWSKAFEQLRTYAEGI